jgi:hypothetical protein
VQNLFRRLLLDFGFIHDADEDAAIREHNDLFHAGMMQWQKAWNNALRALMCAQWVVKLGLRVSPSAPLKSPNSPTALP